MDSIPGQIKETIGSVYQGDQAPVIRELPATLDHEAHIDVNRDIDMNIDVGLFLGGTKGFKQLDASQRCRAVSRPRAGNSDKCQISR